MIVVPTTEAERKWCRDFLWVRGTIELTPATDWLIWERGGMPQWVIAFDEWIGTTCQVHMVSRGKVVLPRRLIYATFQHGFRVLQRTHLFGLVNSRNEAAMRLDKWLGFREVYRVPGAHDEGGDIVVFEMTPADCRWLKDNHG